MICRFPRSKVLTGFCELSEYMEKKNKMKIAVVWNEWPVKGKINIINGTDPLDALSGRGAVG